MPKKLSYDFIKSEFENVGYILLEKGYVNNFTKMKFICPNHPDKDTMIAYGNLKSGKRCAYCSKRNRLTLEEVAEEFTKRGYELLEDEFKDSNTKMRYRCLIHPNKELYIKYAHLYTGSGCPYCAGQIKPDIRDVKSDFSSRDYTLLEDEYKSNKTKMKYRCSKHPEHILTITYSDFKNGKGCIHCWNERRDGENHWNWGGGVSSISEYLRCFTIEWKRNILKLHNYKCFITGTTGNFGDSPRIIV